MDLSKIAIKKIRELIVFTAFLVVVLWKFDVVLDVLKAIWGILFPFVLGGAIAFVTNVPMSFLEKKIFGRVKKENRGDSAAYADNGNPDDEHCRFYSADAKLDPGILS